MEIEYFRKYALKKKSVNESQPFGDDVIVYKVLNKIFMMMNFETPFQISLKCDPELAIELRERYSSVNPAYHMNKTHWNTVDVDGTIPLPELLKMIDHSYNLIVNNFSSKEKKEYNKK